MTLYEIDRDISKILAYFEPDENGMLPENYNQMVEVLQCLDMQRHKKLENVARYILNIRSEIAALKEEEKRLAERRKVLENKEKHLMQYLDNACGGQKTDLGIATLSYRKTERVEVTDYHKAIQFLADNHHSQCIRVFDPEISKTEVKELIRTGVEVPGIEIVKSTSCSLR